MLLAPDRGGFNRSQSVENVWWLIGSYLLLVFVLPVMLSVAVGYRALPCGVRCARCGGDTLQLLSRWLRRASPLLPSAVQRRWCMCCGWEGLVRVPRRQPASGTARTLEVRPLTLNGAPWRVLLQCRRSTGMVLGRLVFVEPSGRLWLDSGDALHGASEDEVLGQARALPDNQLARRLRRIVSD
jgi:hypothetical protein